MSNNTEINDSKEYREQTIVLETKKTNGIGTAGFILSIIALFIGWVPLLGWLIWITGLVLSFIGIFKKPKGLAIAGLVISLLGLILLISIFAGLAILGSLHQ